VILPRATGRLLSGAWFSSVVAAAPADPARIVQPASESAVIGVVSGSEPGRGRWFFTPAPFVVAASRNALDDPAVIPAGPWLAFGLDAEPGAAGFTELRYVAIDRGFAFELDYDGHTRVSGSWRSPRLVIATAPDPFSAIAAQSERLTAARRPAAPPARSTAADWWREPMFCGWGAQCALASSAGQTLAAAAGYASAANYDAFLAVLEREGIVAGTITVDDKWQRAYGTNEPDLAKWPDLRGWIDRRHDRGQRVLLWYKAWDPEGLPDDWCVRSAAGIPIAVDPTHPAAEGVIRQSIRRMLSPDELDADGLKIDFTARTPSGRALTSHGPGWGIALLHRLLDIVYTAAKEAKPDALIVTHTPHPSFVDVTDMIRLNDMLLVDAHSPVPPVVPQMRYRADVVRAACPEVPVDTDDWCVPDLATWRAYLDAKLDFGVPALYYVSHVDATGEPFEQDDYEALRRAWTRWRDSSSARR
jgi:hypothetical protein